MKTGQTPGGFAAINPSIIDLASNSTSNPTTSAQGKSDAIPDKINEELAGTRNITDFSQSWWGSHFVPNLKAANPTFKSKTSPSK